MRVISFLAQETRDTVAINYVSSTIETVIHQTPGDEGSLATKPTYEYVQLFSGQSSDGPPRLRQSQVRRPRPFGRATHTIRSMEQKDVLKALQRDHAAELKLAAKRLKGTARHTEIIPSRTLSELTGHEILLKPENLQVTGSFKIRGAYNKIASLSEEQIARGIVTASAGNHAQGVAYAARERHAKATICMPQITPPLKVDATKAYGADVVREIIGSACPHRTSDIITVSERADEIMNVLNGNYDHGYDVGYGPLTDRVFHPTDQGGLIIATGKPNSGKTDFLNDLTCRLMAKTGRNVCYLSFEVPDKNKHMANLIRLMLGKVNTAAYTREQLQPIVSFMDRHMVHLDLHEVSPTPANIIERAERVKRTMPLKYLIIDPYLFMEMETGRYNTETQAIKGMLTQMQAWGRNNGVWVIIVAHPRSLKKLNGKNELEEIDMYTISGSANWANLADFIFSISRIEEPDRRYTRLDMLKVRDQDLCRTGSVLFVRQPCGRYDERESEEQIMTEMQGKVLDKDRLPWMGLVTP